MFPQALPPEISARTSFSHDAFCRRFGSMALFATELSRTSQAELSDARCTVGLSAPPCDAAIGAVQIGQRDLSGP